MLVELIKGFHRVDDTRRSYDHSLTTLLVECVVGHIKENAQALLIASSSGGNNGKK